jgi:hypothetical protein
MVKILRFNTCAGEPFHIADDLDPKWEGFVQAGDPIQIGLKVTASADLDWNPTYKGSVVFDKNVGDGLSTVLLSQTSTYSLRASLRADGFYKWDFNAESYLLLPSKSTKILLLLGPIRLTFNLDRKEYLEVAPQLNTFNLINFNLNYNSSIFSETINYNYQNHQQSDPWTTQVELNGEITKSELSDNSAFEGLLSLGLYSLVELKIFDQHKTKGGLLFYSLPVGVSEGLDQVESNSSAPSNSSPFLGSISGFSTKSILNGGYYRIGDEALPIVSFLPDTVLNSRSTQPPSDSFCPRPSPTLIAFVECTLSRIKIIGPRFAGYCLYDCIGSSGIPYSRFEYVDDVNFCSATKKA